MSRVVFRRDLRVCSEGGGGEGKLAERKEGVGIGVR
jgi:hypothetical protein